jgi:hypothetical protein
MPPRVGSPGALTRPATSGSGRPAAPERVEALERPNDGARR